MSRFHNVCSQLATKQLYAGGASVAEIAKAQKLTESTIYSRLRKLRILLRPRARKTA